MGFTDAVNSILGGGSGGGGNSSSSNTSSNQDNRSVASGEQSVSTTGGGDSVVNYTDAGSIEQSFSFANNTLTDALDFGRDALNVLADTSKSTQANLFKSSESQQDRTLRASNQSEQVANIISKLGIGAISIIGIMVVGFVSYAFIKRK